MEQFKRTIRTHREGKRIVDQFYVDGDVNVPDAKGDIGQIIYTRGEVKTEEIKTIDNYIRVSGKIQYQILYKEESGETRLSALQGKLPFEEMVYTEEEPESLVYVRDCFVELTATMIHSRKVNVKAAVELELCSSGEAEKQLTLDVEDDGKICTQREERELLELALMKRDTYRIKEEIRLPNTKESVGNILFSDIEAGKLDTRLGEGEVILRGELFVFVMYESVDGKADWTEQTVPYEGRIPCPGVDESMYHHLQASLTDEVIDVRMDADGEMRLIGVEATLEVRVCVYAENRYECLRDVYALDRTLKLGEETIAVPGLVLQNGSKYKLEEMLAVPELNDGMLQMCHAGGSLRIEHTEIVADGVMIEGVLHVHVLYVKASDASPFDAWSGMVPFTYVLPCSGMQPEMEYVITPALEQIGVNMTGSGQMQVQASIGFTIFLTQTQRFRNITDIEEEALDPEEISRMPGIVGYIVKEEDDLWTLARRFRTTMDGIRAANQLEKDVLKPGMKILIFKENMSIL